MKVDIITLFPKMFDGVLGGSILKIAQRKKKLKVKVHNLRDWTKDKRGTADDKPYGGGSGMLLMIEPIHRALESLKKAGSRVILLTPIGKTFDHKAAKKLSKSRHMIMICGHYEGIDERLREFVTDEVSLGDYILTGGEIPAMAVLDAVVRLLPGVLGDENSLKCESFENNLLEYPQYTRPREFNGMRVPAVLLSGNHGEIARWRMKESLKKTKQRRSDLWKKSEASKKSR